MFLQTQALIQEVIKFDGFRKAFQLLNRQYEGRKYTVVCHFCDGYML